MSEIREKLISEIAEDTVKLSKDYPSAVECANELREMLNEDDSEESNLLKLFFGKIESERLAHLQTKKELEELQDAIMEGKEKAEKEKKRASSDGNWYSRDFYDAASKVYSGLINIIEASRKRNNG